MPTQGLTFALIFREIIKKQSISSKSMSHQSRTTRAQSGCKLLRSNACSPVANRRNLHGASVCACAVPRALHASNKG